MDKAFKPSCSFCGAEPGEISQRTELKTTAVYECKKCRADYCDQCSYAKQEKSDVQLCLRCDSVLKKIS